MLQLGECILYSSLAAVQCTVYDMSRTGYAEQTSCRHVTVWFGFSCPRGRDCWDDKSAHTGKHGQGTFHAGKFISYILVHSLQ